MTVEAAHPLERAEYLLHAIDHVRACDEAQVDCTDGGQQLQPDVGGRRTERDYRLWVFLEVVRREPMRLFRHEFLEVHPVQLRIPKRRLSLRIGEMYFTQNCGSAQRQCDARARQPRQH